MDKKKKNGFIKHFFWRGGVNGFFGFFSKLLRLLLKVTKVTTRHQKWPKMGQNSILGSDFAQKAKKASVEALRIFCIENFDFIGPICLKDLIHGSW